MGKAGRGEEGCSWGGRVGVGGPVLFETAAAGSVGDPLTGRGRAEAQSGGFWLGASG